MIKRIKEYLKYVFNGRLHLLFINIFILINQSRFSKILTISSKLSNEEFLKRKKYESSFYHYFYTGKLKKAYLYKLIYAISLLDNNISSKSVINYLNVILDNDIIEYFNLGNLLDKYHANNESNNFCLINEKNINKKKSINKLLFVGPSVNINSINIDNYDYLAFTKPLINNNIKFDDKKLIIILNNQWSHNLDGIKMPMRQVSINWIKKYPNTTVITPFKLRGFKNEIHYFYENEFNSYYPKASPQGLQRGLKLLLNNFHILSLELIGFDFMLSQKPYKNWYPSTTTKYFGSFYPGFIFSNINHDFLFNFMYVKKLKKQFNDQIHGSIDPYLEMPICDVIDLFEKRMKAIKD